MSVPRTVLVLLNDLMFRVKVENSARQAGFEVRFTSTRSDMEAKIKSQSPDLIIVDLNYQGASPLTVIEALKSSGKTKAIPVLGYVSHVQVELKDEALKIGCDRVIARSVLSERLPQILAEFAAGSTF